MSAWSDAPITKASWVSAGRSISPAARTAMRRAVTSLPHMAITTSWPGSCERTVFTRILEIGTHYGGAALAMSKGMGPAADSSVGRIVTVDIVRQGEAATADVPAIVRIRGHSLAPTTIREVCSALEDSGRAIDLLFVDSRHERRHTLENIAVYANRLKPKVIAIDDVNLTNGMRRLWNEVVGIGAGDATDVSKLVDRVSAGFGVIECRYPFHWPELNRLQRASLRVLERGHDRFGPRLPRAVKHALSRFVPR